MYHPPWRLAQTPKTRFRREAIDDVTVTDIETVLKPVWATPTGPYVRSFLERVFRLRHGERLRAARVEPGCTARQP